jgi:predicted methyltransferase
VAQTVNTNFLVLILGYLALFVGANQALAAVDEADVRAAMSHPDRLATDIERDSRSRPEVVIPLLNLESGDSVIDIFAGGGYYSELLARVVGNDGQAILHNSMGFEAWGLNGLNDRFADDRAPVNITRHTRNGVNLMLTDESIDAALIVMAIHDLYVIPKRYNGEAYVRAGNPANSSYFLDQVFAALKPGGRFVVVDHQGNAESDLESITDLHRLDENFIRKEIEAHGFVLVESSDALRNPEDDHDRIVFDEDLQGRTDRFVLAFEKPET